MKVSIGTFNLNNLFSRYNFKGEIEAIKDEKTAVEAEFVYPFSSTDRVKIRKYRGKLVQKQGGIIHVQKVYQSPRVLSSIVDLISGSKRGQ